jgi:hypothetical protein
MEGAGLPNPRLLIAASQDAARVGGARSPGLRDRTEVR